MAEQAGLAERWQGLTLAVGLFISLAHSGTRAESTREQVRGEPSHSLRTDLERR